MVTSFVSLLLLGNGLFQAAQPREETISFVLIANDASQVAVQKGEPLIFTTRISNWAYLERDDIVKRQNELQEIIKTNLTKEEYESRKIAMEGELSALHSYSIGKAGARWQDLIKMQRYSEKTKSWQDLDWKPHLLFFSPDSERVSLGESGYCQADYSLDPEETEKIVSGKYNIRAKAVIADSKTGEEDTIVSREVKVEVLQQHLDYSDIKARYKLADYYLRRGVFLEAEKYVKLIIAEKPSDPMALILMGDVFNGMKKYEDALQCYFKVYSEVKKTNQDVDLRGHVLYFL